jgi:hypothetical protein
MSLLTEHLERQSVLLVEATIPADMTIAEWRHRPVRRGLPPRRRRLGWRPRSLHGGT